jgi:FkbM family methyltransferase
MEAVRRAPVAVKEQASAALRHKGSGRSWAQLMPDDHVREVITKSGLDPSTIVVVSDARFGTQIIRKRTTDWSTYRQVFMRQDWRFKDAAPPRTIIDLGANVGYASVWYHVTYPEARIVAIEPDAGNAAAARVNIALGLRNGADITLEQTAIWHTDSWLKIRNPTGKASGLQVHEAGPTEPGAFRATTVGSIMDRHAMDLVDLVKIDIETSERYLFAENTEWLDRVNCLGIEFHDRIAPGCREPVIAALDRHFVDYNEVVRGENTMFTRRQPLGTVPEI